MLHKTKKNLVILAPKNDIGMDNILRFSGELTSLYYSVSVMAEFLQTSRLNTVHDRVWFKMWNTWEKSVIWPDIILCDPLDSYLGNIMFHSNGSITKTSLWCLSLIWQVHYVLFYQVFTKFFEFPHNSTAAELPGQVSTTLFQVISDHAPVWDACVTTRGLTVFSCQDTVHCQRCKWAIWAIHNRAELDQLEGRIMAQWLPNSQPLPSLFAHQRVANTMDFLPHTADGSGSLKVLVFTFY